MVGQIGKDKVLAGKVALVTGASRGVGKGVALGLGEAGAIVSESPQFIGRAVAALANDPNLMQKAGQVLVAAALALEYGFTDIDGKQPSPLTLQDI